MWGKTTVRISVALMVNMALLGLPAVALGFRISVYPIVSYEEREQGATKERKFAAFGPVFEYNTTGSQSAFAARPLLYHENVLDESSMTDILYPLFHYESWLGADRALLKRKAWLLPLYYHSYRRGSGAATRWRTILFPLYYAGGSDGKTDYRILFPFYWQGESTRVFFPIVWVHRDSGFLALWPLYGHFERLWGRDEIDFLLWPLFIRSRTGHRRAYSLAYPFIAVFRGGGPVGFRLWPLMQLDHRNDGSRRDFFLWPLGHHEVSRRGDDWTTRTLLLPLYVRMRSPQRSVDYIFPYYGRSETSRYVARSYFWPLYTRTAHKKSGHVLHEGLWNLVRFGRTDKKRAWRIFPLFDIERGEAGESTRVAWPLYTHRRYDFAGEELTLRMLLPFYTSARREGKREASAQVLFPVFRQRVKSDGSARRDMLWPFWLARGPGFERNWAPFFRCFSQSRDEKGVAQTNFFGSLYRQSRKGDGFERAFEFLGLGVYTGRDGTRVRFVKMPGRKAQGDERK